MQGCLRHRLEDQATWMEVYEDIRDPTIFERELDLAVERFGLRRLLAAGAERHHRAVHRSLTACALFCLRIGLPLLPSGRRREP